MTVDTAGVPVRCDVTLSDGSRALDRMACAMLLRQARFTPARDANGAPVVAVVREDFTVNRQAGVRRSGGAAETARVVDFAVPVARLPGGGGVMAADLLLTTDASGHVATCDVATSSSDAAIDRVACREMRAVLFAPARDRDGRAVAALRQVSVGFSAGEIARLTP